MEDWGMNNPRIGGIEPLIRRLKENGYGIYLLSNTADTYYQYRHRLPAIEIFDGEFISADYHLLKPERVSIKNSPETFGLMPEENFFIDDRTENIEGAKGCRMERVRVSKGYTGTQKCTGKSRGEYRLSQGLYAGNYI